MEEIPQEKIIEKSSDEISEDLKPKNKNKSGLTSERAKKMVEKAKKSPRHGKHGRLKKTIAIEEAYRRVQEKIIERSMKLIDTQTLIAHGTIKIFCIHSHWEGNGKKKSLIRDRPYLVENDEDIINVIDYQYGGGETDPNKHEKDDDEYDYYFISTKDPDNRAIKDQLDRIGLKAPDKIDITSEGKEIKQVTLVPPSANTK